jgi:hypothetical protein
MAMGRMVPLRPVDRLRGSGRTPSAIAVDTERLTQQVGLAQPLVQEKPDSAVAALRQMLTQPESGGRANEADLAACSADR